jgi:hypothetical protein
MMSARLDRSVIQYSWLGCTESRRKLVVSRGRAGGKTSLFYILFYILHSRPINS